MSSKGKVLYTVSIVIPAYNEARTLEKILGALYNQDYPKEKMEVLVIDDNSSDNTSEIAKKFPVKYFLTKDLGQNKCLNLGIKNSKGDIIIFLHADCVPLANNWIKKMLEPFEDMHIGVVVSYLVLEIDRIPPPTKYFCYINIPGWHHTSAEIASDHLPKGYCEINMVGSNCHAYRRKLLEDVGGFDPILGSAPAPFKGGDEFDISEKIRKLGYKIILNHNARTLHDYSDETSHPNSFKYYFRKAIQYGTPEPLIFLRYHYFINNDLVLAFLCLLYALPASLYFFLTSLYGLPIPIGNTLIFGALVPIIVFLIMKLTARPRYYLEEPKEAVPHRLKLIVKIAFYLAVFSVLIWFSLNLRVPISIVALFFPTYMGISILTARSVSTGLIYFLKSHRFIESICLTMSSFIWGLIYGGGVLSGCMQVLCLRVKMKKYKQSK